MRSCAFVLNGLLAVALSFVFFVYAGDRLLLGQVDLPGNDGAQGAQISCQRAGRGRRHAVRCQAGVLRYSVGPASA